MPTWLTFLGSVVATAGFFGALYVAVCLFVSFRRAKARPRLGLAPGDKSGTLAFWVTWEPKMFAVQAYRLRVTHFSPDNIVKEGQFTVTFEPPLKASFIQQVELPSSFKDLLEDKTGTKRAIINVQMKTIEEMTTAIDVPLDKAQSVYLGRSRGVPTISTKLKPAVPDEPVVTSLCYSELVSRKQKLKELADQAKAKEKKAVPVVAPATASKPATATPGVTTATPASVTTAAASPKPAAATTTIGTATAPPVTKPAAPVTGTPAAVLIPIPTPPSVASPGIAPVAKPVVPQDQPIPKPEEKR